jgi:hypothetical protein
MALLNKKTKNTQQLETLLKVSKLLDSLDPDIKKSVKISQRELNRGRVVIETTTRKKSEMQVVIKTFNDVATKFTRIPSDVSVNSSWIDSIAYDPATKTGTMRLLSGREYEIYRFDSSTYEEWALSPSKGRYFNYYIKNGYNIVRSR